MGHDGGKVLVVTALPVETQAVTDVLTGLSFEQHGAGPVLWIGTYSAGTSSWEIAVAETGSGNVVSAVRTVSAIGSFGPDEVFFVGVAGGLKDMRVGDVVFATRVYSYEGAKDTATGSLPRTSTYAAKPKVEGHARLVAGSEGGWRGFAGARAVVKPIAAGEKLVASSDSATAELLRTYYSDAVAVEMEGAGFSRACFTSDIVAAGVIRGISDILDDREKTNQELTQAVAARNAASFFFTLLECLEMTRDAGPAGTTPAAGRAPSTATPDRSDASDGTGGRDAAPAHRAVPESAPSHEIGPDRTVEPLFSELVSGPWVAVSSPDNLRLLEVSDGLLRAYERPGGDGRDGRDGLSGSTVMAVSELAAAADGAVLVGTRDDTFVIATVGVGGDVRVRNVETPSPVTGGRLLALTCRHDAVRVIVSGDDGTTAFRISSAGSTFAFERLDRRPSLAFVEFPDGVLRVDGDGQLVLAGWPPALSRGLPADGWTMFDRAVGEKCTIVAGLRTVGSASVVHVVGRDGDDWRTATLSFGEVVDKVHIARPSAFGQRPRVLLAQVGRWISAWSLEELWAFGALPSVR